MIKFGKLVVKDSQSLIEEKMTLGSVICYFPNVY